MKVCTELVGRPFRPDGIQPCPSPPHGKCFRHNPQGKTRFMSFIRLYFSALLAVLVLLWAPAVSLAKEATATPVERIKTLPGFQVELLYTVPKDQQGSWVSMTTDPAGRLIVSDQYGGLYRVTPPAAAADTKVEKLPLAIGGAQGLLWAFDSLYVVVNNPQFQVGVHRAFDSNGDGELDQVELLQPLEGGGREHGPHAAVLAPDGKSIYIVCGNQTKLPKFDRSRVPLAWDEDLLLPRIYGRGFMKDVPAPGGFIAKMKPDGTDWEIIATGFRNQYDAAFNRRGELFTFDADMEWDMNTPWYRPTRINHVVSGGEFGWRNGSGKWPAYYGDSLPAAVDIGPGSPTGVTFGHGAKFPAKYQNALFACDWSYGKLYAVHLQPEGASYGGAAEEFLSGLPLPLTDIVVHPTDGAMYFTIGGRRTQSGLYRMTYSGDASTEPADDQDEQAAAARATRHKLEAFHGQPVEGAVETVWPYLGSDDRFLRYAARVAIEWQPVDSWQLAALEELNPRAAITALMALARVGDSRVQERLLASLDRIDWEQLDAQAKLDLLRCYSLTFSRMGKPDESDRQRTVDIFSVWLPSEDQRINIELLELLVYLEDPTAAEKGSKLLESAPSQEEQIAYAKSLRLLKKGWTLELRQRYFQWLADALNYRGGASFGLFVQEIKNDAVANLPPEAKQKLQPLIDTKPANPSPSFASEQRPFVKEWTVDELEKAIEQGLSNRDFAQGKQMFGVANCFSCHRFDEQGGAIGPDLTGLSGRMSTRDLLESIIEPSKAISDQYAAVNIVTVDGKIVSGRIANLSGDSYKVITNMLDPAAMTDVKVDDIEDMALSEVSMMPTGLLNTLTEEEVLDLMAYLLSRGDTNHEMFKKK